MEPRLRKQFLGALPWSLFWFGPVRELGRAFYRVGWTLGWVWPFMFTAGALLFTPFDQLLTTNPLEWRSFGIDDPLMRFMNSNYAWGDFSNHHFLNLMAEGVLCFALALWFSRKTGRRLWEFGLLASYGAVLTWSIHEGLWWLTYAVLWKPDPIVFSGFGEIMTVSLCIFTAALGLYVPKRYLLGMLAFQLVWAFVGFPITESYKGQTALYGTVWADGWEVASWFWATFCFFEWEKDRLLKWYERTRTFLVKPLGVEL